MRMDCGNKAGAPRKSTFFLIHAAHSRASQRTLLPQLRALLKPRANAVDDDDLVPKCAFRQNGCDVADREIDIWKIGGDVRRENQKPVRVQRRFRAAFDPDQGPDIRIDREHAWIAHENRLLKRSRRSCEADASTRR